MNLYSSCATEKHVMLQKYPHGVVTHTILALCGWSRLAIISCELRSVCVGLWARVGLCVCDRRMVRALDSVCDARITFDGISCVRFFMRACARIIRKRFTCARVSLFIITRPRTCLTRRQPTVCIPCVRFLPTRKFSRPFLKSARASLRLRVPSIPRAR